MYETWTTLQGWVGSEVEARETAHGTVATFRIGCTPRFLKDGEWTDGTTSWYSVNAWRGLAENVLASIRKGDAVVVHGRLRIDVWEREDSSTSATAVVEAAFVGHDLTRGTTQFTRSGRTERPDTQADSTPRQPEQRDASAA